MCLLGNNKCNQQLSDSNVFTKQIIDMPHMYDTFFYCVDISYRMLFNEATVYGSVSQYSYFFYIE